MKVGAPSQSGRNGILAALTGSPVMTVPAGFGPASKEAPRGVPVGMEILGRAWSEGKLLGIAKGVEGVRRVRRMPALTEKFVEKRSGEGVPVVVPDTKGIPKEYPIGVL